MKLGKVIIYALFFSCLVALGLFVFNHLDSLSSCSAVRQKVAVTLPLPDSLKNEAVKPDTVYKRIVLYQENKPDTVYRDLDTTALKPKDDFDCFKYFKYRKTFNFDSVGFDININAKLNTSNDSLTLYMNPENIWYEKYNILHRPNIRNPTQRVKRGMRWFFYINTGRTYTGEFTAGGSLLFLWRKYSVITTITNSSATVGFGMELKFK